MKMLMSDFSGCKFFNETLSHVVQDHGERRSRSRRRTGEKLDASEIIRGKEINVYFA